jgi:hypothetical protein
VCASCGAPRSGKFCTQCGEKELHHEDLTLRAFVEQVLGGFTHFDSKALRTFNLLLTKPGLLAADYVRGARVRTMRPLQLFFFVNLLYFVFQPFTSANTFNTTLETQTHGLPYSKLAAEWVEARRSALGLTFEAYAERFDHASSSWSRALLILMTPMLAGVFALLHVRKRRTFVEHLVLALGFFSFYLLVVCLVAMPLIQLGALGLFKMGFRFVGGFRDLEFSVIVSVLAAVYLAAAFRRFYGDSRASSYALAVAAIVGMALLLQLYRGILFLVVFTAG